MLFSDLVSKSRNESCNEAVNFSIDFWKYAEEYLGNIKEHSDRVKVTPDITEKMEHAMDLASDAVRLVDALGAYSVGRARSRDGVPYDVTYMLNHFYGSLKRQVDHFQKLSKEYKPQ